MKKDWNKVSREHVLRAINLFESKREDYPEPKNTFLIRKNKKYPAKHIRGIAYKIANKREIKKSEYTGGQETVNFFCRLGFTVQYKNKIISSDKERLKKLQVLNKEVQTIGKPKRLNVVSQKNALQKLLQKKIGIIEMEKKFDWLKTPDPKNIPKEYKKITKALLKHRNQAGFLKSIHKLSCDFVLEERKLIIEYDENQHFSKARQITLEKYPRNVKLSFPKNYWIEQCKIINAKDNYPIDRDERRAYYDSVRDIESHRNGYSLVRIKHGDFDWESKNAFRHLSKLIPGRRRTENNYHKIGRIVLYGNLGKRRIISNFEKLHDKVNNKKFDIIMTPGGFLTFPWLKELLDVVDSDIANEKYLRAFYREAEDTIEKFFGEIRNFNKLKNYADFISIGIDSYNPNTSQSIELVALYSFKKSKVVRWTGKSYPTNNQFNRVIRINDLDSHFIKLKRQKIVILGCHDLNVFSPRAWASAKGWRRKTGRKFLSKVRSFNPDIIIQHPHYTDTPDIWNLAWRTVEKKFPNIKHFASGIRYYRIDMKTGRPAKTRSSASKVKEKTKKGDVVDIDFR